MFAVGRQRHGYDNGYNPEEPFNARLNPILHSLPNSVIHNSSSPGQRLLSLLELDALETLEGKMLIEDSILIHDSRVNVCSIFFLR